MKNHNLFRFGLIVVTVLSIFILASCGGSSAPSGSNQASVDGNTGTSSGGIPVKCDGATGNVHIPAGSFSGTETIKIECVDSVKAEELAQLVKEELGETNEILGAITLNPSPFDFDKDVTLTIPLMAQRKDLADTFQDLYVYTPNESNQLTLVNQASIASDGWSGSASTNHFSTFVLVGSPASAPSSGGSSTFRYSIDIPADFNYYTPNTKESSDTIYGVSQCNDHWTELNIIDETSPFLSFLKETCIIGMWSKPSETQSSATLIAIWVNKVLDIDTRSLSNIVLGGEGNTIISERETNISGSPALRLTLQANSYGNDVCRIYYLFAINGDIGWRAEYHSECVAPNISDDYFKQIDTDAEKVLSSFELK